VAAVEQRADLAAAAKPAWRRYVRAKRDDYFEVETKKNCFSYDLSCVVASAELSVVVVAAVEAHLAAKVLLRASSSRVSCDDPCGRNGGYRRSTGTHDCPCERRRDVSGPC